MKTVIKGKVITNTYSLYAKKVKGKDGDYYNEKPRLEKESECEWEDILYFDGQLRYNEHPNTLFPLGRYLFNISEDETVSVEKSIFRADLNEMHVFSNKVIREIDVDLETIKYELDVHMSEFNKQMIESDEKLTAYCKLHGLYPEYTDFEELFKIVYDNATWSIKDGKLKVTQNLDLDIATITRLDTDYLTTATSNVSFVI